MSLRSRFTNPQRLADEYSRRGDFQRAIETYGKAGDWRRAAEIAAQVKNEEELVRCSLMAGLGRIPQGYADADAVRAAELLASQKHHDLAIPLFEMAWELHRAAECALAARDPVRAARLYERAGDRLEAARCYQSAGKPKEALQLLEEGSKTTPGGLLPAGKQEETALLRVEILCQLGRDSAAAALLDTLPPSRRLAELLEQAGRLEEAIHCHLELRDTEQAARVAAKHPDRDRLLARVHLRSGRAVEAGHLFAQIGLTREAAEAYEKGGDWGRAAYRWEAAGEPWRAAEAYEKAGRLRDAERCYTAAGLAQRAAEVAERAKTRAKSPPRLRPGRALKEAAAHLEAGDKVRAASVLMQIHPTDAEYAKASVLLAPLLIEERFYDDALARLRGIPPDAGPELACDRFYWEGRTLEAMGDKAGAEACYKQTLALVPGHTGARKQLDRLHDPEPDPLFATVASDFSGIIPEPTAPQEALLPEGYRLAGRYDILSLIASGGMGRVYKAHDRELEETVAIKTVLRREESGGSEEVRLFREVQICRRISHPNVVRVYDLGRFPGGVFVTMEYLEGRTLDQVVRTEHPIPFERIRGILSEVAAGLREAHDLGVVHRDLKPSNVMVTATRVKILDFGIARIRGVDARLTQVGFIMGSPMYMSPDQLLSKELDGRSDLYALGILGYTLVAGREPFRDPDPTVLALRQLREAPPDIRRFRPETPAAWIDLLDRLMAKEPEDRFQSAAEVLSALSDL